MNRTLISIIVTVVWLIFGVTPAYANVNNFHISTYDIKYDLSRDNEGRSTLRTTETITAEFPSYDQNRGIERYLPRSYDGHSVSLRVDAVRDAAGQERQYTTYDSGEYLVVRIGDPDRYVHGRETYVLTYTQRDVTKTFTDTQADEFYWDTNGTAWRVPIRQLNISLNIEDGLANELTGQYSCYVGGYAATDQCEIVRNDNTFTASASNLATGHNITLALGFQSQTFSAYEQPLIERLAAIWAMIQGLLTVVSVGLVIWLVVRYILWSGRKKEIGTIIPEYLPPKDSSVSLAATLFVTQSSFAAQLIDLAVRHYIKIYETKAPSTWSTGTYEVEVVRPIDNLREEEREFLSDIFNGSPVIGAKIDTKQLKKDQTLSMRLMDNPMKIQRLKRSVYAIQQKNPEQSAWFRKAGIITLVSGLLFFSLPLLIVAAIAMIMSLTLWVLTDKGLNLYRYLQGLKLYISVAEQDRLRMLQSPEGAQKVQVDANDPRSLVKLYERVLPYAVLFGQEKQWNKQLGDYYQSTGTRPDWYTGANLIAFNAAAFSSAMTNLTTSINSTGASYSSSGGSSGGGSSGGGGGGGGGGGW